MQTRSNTFLWVTYDFANSIVMIVFFLYFAQWIVVDRGISDFYFNLTFTISALLLLLTAPLFGVVLDKFLRRITGLRYSTIFTALFYGLSGLSAVYGKNIPALIFFTLGLYAYLQSFTFYTPLINDIAHSSKRGLISGLGIMANYLGQITGLVIALPFSQGKVALFSAAPRAETLLPSVILFFILSLPMLIFFKEPKKDAPDGARISSAMRGVISETKHLLSHSSVAIFLLSYFLFNDAILTAVNNFPIFLEQVWSISDTTKTYLMLSILVMCAIGGLIAGFLADRYGHKKILVIILAFWLVMFPVIGLATNFKLFVTFAIFMGLWFGATWAVSRSLMSHICPEGKHNLAFAYFGLAERASSFIGPIVWGLVVTNLVTMGNDRYRIAFLAITGFILLGLLALIKVRDDRHHPSRTRIISSGSRI